MRTTKSRRKIEVSMGLERLVELLPQRPEILAAYLYGSYGTELQTPLSDVDLAFVCRSHQRLDLDHELELRASILAALGEDRVSITFLRQSGPMFQFEVLETARRLYCADEGALADFIAEVLSRHADYRIDHERFLREYDQARREELAEVPARH